MPYQLLTNVGNYDALLENIRDFAVATGDWTVNQNLIGPDEGASASGRQLVMTNGDCLVGMRSTTATVGFNRLYLFDGVPPYAAANLDSLPNNSGLTYDNAIIISASQPSTRHLQQYAGPFPTVHLFSDDPSTYIHCAIEVSAGIWKHLAFGNLIKFGTWTGGGYYACSYWDTSNAFIDQPASTSHHVLFDNNPVTNNRSWTVHYQGGGQKWLGVGNADQVVGAVTRQAGRASFRGGFGKMFKNIPESLFSGFIPLGPVLITRVKVDDTPDTVRFIGQVPDIRTVNMTNLAPADELTIGSDVYLCFPFAAKNGQTDQYNSGVGGIAYRKHT